MPTTKKSDINKYHRPIAFERGSERIVVYLDVYDVVGWSKTQSDGSLRRSRLSDAPLDHAIKKLLAPGERGHKDLLTDLIEARQALDRAIQLERGVQDRAEPR